MAPLYTLEENINTTEECRKNIINAVNTLDALVDTIDINTPLTQIAPIINNSKYIPVYEFLNAKTKYDSTTGVAKTISKDIKLNRGYYKLYLLGGGSDGGAAKWSGNNNQAVSGAGGGGIIVDFFVKNPINVRLIAGGPGTIMAGYSIGYTSSRNNGAASIFSIKNNNNTFTEIFRANGGTAGFVVGGESNLSTSNTGLSTGIYKATGGTTTYKTNSNIEIQNIKQYKAPNGNNKNAYGSSVKSSPPDSVFYDITLNLEDLSKYIINNNNGCGATTAHASNGSYKKATGGLVYLISYKK